VKNKTSLIVISAALVALFAQSPAFSQSAPVSGGELLPITDGAVVADPSSATVQVDAGVQPGPVAATSEDAAQQELEMQTASSPKLIPIEPPAVVVDQPAIEGVSGAFKLPLNKTRALDVDGKVRDIVIGNSTIADVVVRSPTQIYLVGRAIGSTNVFLMNEAGAVLRQVEVVVEPDQDGVNEALRTMFPNENVRASAVGNSIIVSGSVSSDGVAAQVVQVAQRFVGAPENVVNMMVVGKEQQVLLKVRIAEITKNANKEMGALYQLLDPVNIGNAAITYFGGFGIVGSGGFFNIQNPNDYNATFRFLETQGLAKTLAEPNLLAVSGENAAFLAGGEFPIPVNQDADTTTVEFRTFGVSLSFLPVVLSSGNISLRLATEVSQIDRDTAVSVSAGNGSFVVPGLTTRRAESTIELPSGGSIMIAGLLQNDIQESLAGVPGLMNVPILGSLFRSPQFQRRESELVVTVTAFLAKSVDPSDLVLPTDGFAPSHDLDRYFIGRLQNIYVKVPPSRPDMSSVQGPIGYIID
jgi:pilus assembly protein CpaC